jgi:hypothetical protein
MNEKYCQHYVRQRHFIIFLASEFSFDIDEKDVMNDDSEFKKDDDDNKRSITVVKMKKKEFLTF